MSFPVKCQCFLTSQENIFYISLSTLDHTCTRCLLFFIFNITLICSYTVGCPTMYTLSFSIELPYSGGKNKNQYYCFAVVTRPIFPGCTSSSAWRTPLCGLTLPAAVIVRRSSPHPSANTARCFSKC